MAKRSAKKSRRWRRRLARRLSSLHRRPLGSTFVGLEYLEARTLLSGSIAGAVFNDIDGNGSRGAAEAGLNGVIVQLFNADTGALIEQQVTADIESDGNPGIDPLTEVGRYLFSDVAAGNYRLVHVPPDGAHQTAPNGFGLIENQNITGINALVDATQDIVLGDFDGDGDDDALAMDIGDDAPAPAESTDVAIFQNGGEGQFTFIGSTAFNGEVRAIESGDLNGDGLDDLIAAVRRRDAVTGLSDVHIISLVNSGNGQFFEADRITLDSGLDPKTLLLTDLTGDGHVDVIVGSSDLTTPPPHDGRISIFVADGNGGLIEQDDYDTDGVPLALVATDLNNDNRIDILHAGERFDNNAGEFRGYLDILLRANGSTVRFTHQSGGDAPLPVNDIAIGNINNDNKPDIIMHLIANDQAAPVEDIASHYAWLRNLGGFNYADHEVPDLDRLATNVAFVDVDDDGDLDIVSLDAPPGEPDAATLTVQRNNGNGTFTVEEQLPFTGEASSFAVGDLDGDGDQDAVVGALDLFGDGVFYAVAHQSAFTITLGADEDFDADDVGQKILAAGVVEGTVVDDAAAPLGGITVQLVNRLTGQVVATQTTDANAGTYRFENVAPGSYEVHQRGLVGFVQVDPSGFGFSQTTTIEDLLANDPDAGQLPGHIVSLDVNGDGNADLITTATDTAPGSLRTRMTIQLGRGDGGFFGNIQLTLPGELHDLQAAGDQLLALTASTADAASPTMMTLLTLQEDGTFSSADPVALPDGFGAVADTFFGDLDDDDDLDVVIVGDSGLTVFANNAGVLTEGQTLTIAGDAYRSVAAADMDNDGDLDLIVAGERTGDESGIVRVLKQGTALQFTADGAQLTADNPVEAVLAGNVNAQNVDDLILVFFDHFQVALNNGSGNLTAQQTTHRIADAQTADLVDVDGDGTLDVVAIDGDGLMVVFEGIGDGTFALSTMAQTAGDYQDALAVDLDGDGDVDFAGFGEGELDIRLSMPPHQVIVTDGLVVSNVDFTNDRLPTGIISGFVANDVGDVGLNGVTVQLIDTFTGQVIAEQVTVNGDFEFQQVLVGAYRLRQIVPDGFIASSPQIVTSQLFATDGTNLLRLDVETGASVEIGAIGFDDVTGLVFTAEGRLFGSALDEASDPVLIEISPITGIGTLVGALTAVMPDLAFDPLLGVMYGHGNDDVLYALDPDDVTDGDVNAVAIGAAGAGVSANDRGLVVDPLSGNLLTIIDGELLTYDSAGGAGVQSQLSGDAPRTIRALTYHTSSGDYFASFDPFDNQPDALIRIDPVTGNILSQIESPTGLDALAWSPSTLVGETDLVVTANQVIDDIRFGNVAEASLATVAGLSDFDGAFVQLLNSNGSVVGSTIVTAGSFDFDRILPGNYTVTQIAPTATPVSVELTLAAGEDSSGIVFVSDAPTVADDLEGRLGNDTFSLATRVAADSAINASIDGLDDDDLYRFELLEGGFVALDIEAREGALSHVDTILRLFDVDGNELAASDNDVDPDSGVYSSDAALRWHVAAAGTYYVGVSAVGPDEGAYALDIAFTPDAADPFAGDHSDIASAVDTALDTNTPFDAITQLAEAGELDLFSFDALAGEVIRAHIGAIAIGLPLDAQLTLLDDSSQTLLTIDGSGDPQFDFALPTDGTYYVGVTGASSGWYELNLSLTAASGADPFEPNDDLASSQAIVLTEGVSQRVAGSIADADDLDFYEIILGASGVLSLDIDAGESGLSDLSSSLMLLDASGDEIAFNHGGVDPQSGYVGPDAVLRHLIDSAGTYYVVVSGSNSGAYELNALFEPIVLTGDEVDDAPLVLPPFESVRREADIDSPADVDRFAMNLAAGDMVLLSVDAFVIGSALNAQLRVLDSNGVELAAINDAGTFDPSLTFVAPESGAFIVEVSSVANDGRYTLHAKRLPRGSEPETLHLRSDHAQTLHGNLAAAGDDRYALTLDSPGLVSFNVDGFGDLDPVATLLNAAGEVVARSDDHAFGLGSRLEAVVGAGDYTLVISGFADDGGDYQLEALTSERFDVIATEETTNTHRIQVRAGDVVTIDIDAHRLGSNLDPIIRVLDGNDVVLATNDAAVDPVLGHPGFDSAVQLVAQEDGELVVEVTGRLIGAPVDAAAAGAYLLNVTIAPAGLDAPDAIDTNKATVIDGELIIQDAAGNDITIEQSGPGAIAVQQTTDGDIASIHITGADATTELRVTMTDAAFGSAGSTVGLITSDATVATIDLGAGLSLIDGVILGSADLIHIGGNLLGHIHLDSAGEIDVDGNITASAAITTEGDVDRIEATEIDDAARIDVGGTLGELFKTFIVRSGGFQEYLDADGDTIRVAMTGPGAIEVVRVAGAGDVDALTHIVTGATAATTITITGGATAVTDILITGPLGNFRAATLQLLGDLTADSSIGVLQLGDVTDQHLITIGAPQLPGQQVTLLLGHVVDTTIDSQSPIGLLSVLSWTDNDPDVNPDIVSASNIAILRSTGDFGAGLMLSGHDNPAAATLNVAIIGGALGSGDANNPAVWSIDGRVNALTATGGVNGWRLGDATSVNILNLGAVVDGDVDIVGPINAIVVADWAAGALAATSVNTLQGSGDVNFDLALTGEANVDLTINVVTIVGSMTGGNWSVDGLVNNITAAGADGWQLNTTDTLNDAKVNVLSLGAVGTAQVNVAGSIGSLLAQGWQSGGVTAESLRELNIDNDFAGAVTLSGAAEAGSPTLASATIGGTLGNGNDAAPAAWSVTGLINRIGAQSTNGWRLTDVTEAVTIDLGAATHAEVDVPGNIATLRANQWIAGQLIAATLRSLVVVGDFDLPLELTGPDTIGADTITLVRIGGVLGGAWSVLSREARIFAGSVNDWSPDATLTGSVDADADAIKMTVRWNVADPSLIDSLAIDTEGVATVNVTGDLANLI